MVLRQTSLRKTHTHDRMNTRKSRREYQKPVFPFKMNTGKRVVLSKKSFSSASLDKISFDIIAALKPESAARVCHHRIPAAVFCYQGLWSSIQKEFFRPQFAESVSQLVGPVRDELVSNLAVKVSYSWLCVRAYSSNGSCLTEPTSYPAS